MADGPAMAADGAVDMADGVEMAMVPESGRAEVAGGRDGTEELRDLLVSLSLNLQVSLRPQSLGLQSVCKALFVLAAGCDVQGKKHHAFGNLDVGYHWVSGLFELSVPVLGSDS